MTARPDNLNYGGSSPLHDEIRIVRESQAGLGAPRFPRIHGGETTPASDLTQLNLVTPNTGVHPAQPMSWAVKST